MLDDLYWFRKQFQFNLMHFVKFQIKFDPVVILESRRYEMLRKLE